MPRPVFGAVDWWTFAELDDPKRFAKTVEGSDDLFETSIACDADDFAEREFGSTEPAFDEERNRSWPTLEFCVSRGTKTVLMARRRT